MRLLQGYYYSQHDDDPHDEQASYSSHDNQSNPSAPSPTYGSTNQIVSIVIAGTIFILIFGVCLYALCYQQRQPRVIPMQASDGKTVAVEEDEDGSSLADTHVEEDEECPSTIQSAQPRQELSSAGSSSSSFAN